MGPIQEDNGRREVVCERCSRVTWVDYQEAVKLMQSGRAWIKHRQVREGEGLMTPGELKSVPYLAGLCENCDRGIMRPSVEWEGKHLAERVKHFIAVGVDPENATSYAIEEYQTEFMRTFQPEFFSWWTFGGWDTSTRQAQFEGHTLGADVDFSLLPPEFLGEEEGLGDGSHMCPHVYDAPNWDNFNDIVGGRH